MSELLFTIRPRDDLGAMGAGLGREHLTVEGVRAWLDENEDVGTFEIVDERDGQEACIYEFEEQGAPIDADVYPCGCGRPTCPERSR